MLKKRILNILGYLFLLCSLMSLISSYSKTKSVSYTWLTHNIQAGDGSMITTKDHHPIESLPSEVRIQIAPGHFVAIGNIQSWIVEAALLNALGLTCLVLSSLIKGHNGYN